MQSEKLSRTLFADASLLGPAFKFMETRLMSSDSGVLMMILPPGGFLVTGLLVVSSEPRQKIPAHSAGATIR